MTDSIVDYIPFSKLMGVEVTEATKDKITGTLTVREDLCTTGKIMHGGAVMAFADTLGAVGAFLNLPKGAKATTTVESKTNFLGAAPLGSNLIAETKPVKIGRRLSVWQTEIKTDKGRQVALVTQSQLVLS